MLKRQAIFLIVLISVVAFSSLAWSSVVGTWNVTGEVKVTVSLKIRGVHSQKTTEPFGDKFTFNSAGATFVMTDMDGFWSSKKANFVVALDVLDVEKYFEEALSVDATVTSLKFKGSEKKDGTIKGTFTMKMVISVPNLNNASGKVSVSGKWTGAKALPTGDVSAFSQEQTISEAIAQKVFDAISAHGLK